MGVDMTTLVSLFLSAVLGLTVLTNIIVQVIKGITYDKIPTNLLAFIVAFIVTGCSFYVWVSMENITVFPWMFIAAIGVAFGVALSAMFGFDKLKELVAQWDNIRLLRKGGDKNGT